MAECMMKTGIFTLPDLNMTNLEGVRQVASAGLPAFEPFASKEMAEPDFAAAEAIRDEAKKLGVELPCFSMLADLTREGEPERLKKYVDAAERMGVSLLHHTIYPSFAPEERGRPFEPLLERILPGLREVYDYGEKRGVQCVFEDQGFQFNGVRNFALLLEKLDRPAGVVLDMGNIAFMDEHADDFAQCFAERIVHVHVKDFAIRKHAVAGGYNLPGGSCLEAVDLGEGDMHIRRALKVLKDCGYDGWYMLECSPLSDPYAEQRKNMDTLNGMLRDA